MVKLVSRVSLSGGWGVQSAVAAALDALLVYLIK